MINPQIENGYTKIANEIMEALSATRIAGEQMQCLLFILRKTYGFNKKEDTIPLSQFVKATGIRKPHICRALNNLKERKIIVTKNGNKKHLTYSFNKRYDQWKSLPKMVTLPKTVIDVARSGNQTLPKMVTPSIYTKETTSKETTSKETLTKERKIKLHSSDKRRSLVLSNPDIDICKGFLEYLKEYHPNKINALRKGREDWQIYETWLSDIRILNDKGYDRDQIIACIKFAMDNTFWKKNFYSLSKLNKKNKNGDLYVAYFLDEIKNEDKTITSDDIMEMLK